MSEKSSRTGLLSLLTAPLKAARRVARRAEDDIDDDNDADEVRRLMAAALGTGQTTEPRQTARLTDESFRMAARQLRQEEEGAFQIKLHIISLVEFHEAVGTKWARVADKVMMIAEGVINMHLGTGNMFGRQGSDFFVLLFRTCDNAEARRRSITIAQELGTRLVGDQFLGEERPLALAAEISMDDGLNPDGSLNLTAVQGAVSEIRSILVAQTAKNNGTPSWMRPGTGDQPKPEPRRAWTPCAPEEKAAANGAPPIAITGETGPKAPPKDPGWKPLDMERKAAVQDATWVILDMGGSAKPLPPGLEETEEPATEPLPADARLALLWRPTWVAAGEAIGAYQARIQRVDNESKPALEGTQAYPRGDETGANTLDRFCIAGAIRDFRASEAAGNQSAIVLPIHWSTLTAENRMEFLAPFADLTQQSRGARVVIDLFGVPKDVKPTTLGAAIENARQLCREVALRTRLSAPRVALALDCGASMVGIDLSELAQPERTDDIQLLDALRAFAEHAGKARLGTYVWGVRRRKVVTGAVRAGFAMVNGPALMKDIPKPAKVLPAPKARFTMS